MPRQAFSGPNVAFSVFQAVILRRFRAVTISGCRVQLPLGSPGKATLPAFPYNLFLQ